MARRPRTARKRPTEATIDLARRWGFVCGKRIDWVGFSHYLVAEFVDPAIGERKRGPGEKALKQYRDVRTVIALRRCSVEKRS